MTPPTQSEPNRVWVLRRGPHEPMVWPFATEDQAGDFALDHGLLDWRVEPFDDPRKEHQPLCACCHEPWPCRHVRIEQHAHAIVHAAANRCARCRKQIGWYKVTFRAAGELGEDLHYHGKLGACFNEAKRLAAERQDEGALRDIARAEEGREWSRQMRRQRAA